MYVIKKIFNNNSVLVEDESHVEQILLGKGIAFQKKANEIVDKNKIDKKFIFDSTELQEKMSQMFDQTPYAMIELASRIIDQAEESLQVKFDDYLYIGLSDHLHYALERARSNKEMPNNLVWEIKRFYPKEYQVAKQSLKIIHHEEGIWLNEDEVGYIALHFVNAQESNIQFATTIQLTEIIQAIMRIVQFYFKKSLDEDSIDYTRFVTHIHYFLQRLFNGERPMEEEDNFVFEQIKLKYPDSFQCTLQIEKYLEKRLNTTLSNEEKLYFMIHINRVINKREKEGD